MAKSIRILVLLLIVILLAGSCMIPFTGTVWVYNNLGDGRAITGVYIYAAGGSATTNLLANPIVDGDLEYFPGVAPGGTTVEAAIEGGATAKETLTVKDGTIQYVYITTADIV